MFWLLAYLRTDNRSILRARIPGDSGKGGD